MGLYEYGVMVAALTAIAISLGFGAVRLRARLVPTWSGTGARLAECMLALSALVVALQILGIIGALRAWPLLAASGGVGIAMSSFGPRPAAPTRAHARSPLPAAIAAIAAALLVLFEWGGSVLASLHRGIGDGDSLWYHMPFAAGFAQEGSITGLHITGPDYLSWFYPANCELVHSLGILLAGNHDVLSPLISVGWLALALLAAWCVGRPFGAGAPCVAAVGLVLGAQLIVQREPGAARTDVAGMAFLLASAALLLNGDRARSLARGTVALAALAAGLAIGTKLTLLPAVAVFSAAVIVINKGHRLATGAIWSGCLFATGGFWYVRNLVYAGNPLPWVRLGVGPITLASPAQDPSTGTRHSILQYATEPAVWKHYFIPGLHTAFGPLWPLVLILAATGAVWAATSGSPIQRALGLAAVATALAYVVNPLSAPGPEGAPVTFEANLRYLAPGLVLGLVVLPTVLPSGTRARWLAFAALAGLLLVTAQGLDLGRHDLAGVTLIVAMGGAWAVAALLLSHQLRLAGGLVAAVSLMVLVSLGWPIARDYLRDRYAGRTDSKLAVPHMDAAYHWASRVGDARIATTSVLQYGLYGQNLSNRVSYLGVERDGDSAPAATCRAWRAALDAGHFDFLVLAPTYEQPAPPAPARWLRSRHVEPILRSRPTAVFRISGRLGSAGCSSLSSSPEEGACAAGAGSGCRVQQPRGEHRAGTASFSFFHFGSVHGADAGPR